MISIKMKEDAAKISTEIKKFATKVPLAFLNYSYLNEDPKVVLDRRNNELNEVQKNVKEFLNDSDTFSEVLRNCQADFKDVKEQLMRFGVEMNDELDDAPRDRSNNTSTKNYLTVPSSNVLHHSRIP